MIYTLFLMFFASNYTPTFPVNGIAIDPVTIYMDSTFESKTLGFYKTNEVFSVNASSIDYREDEDQDLKFKWYKVLFENKEAWVFGGSVALDTKESTSEIESLLDRRINLSGSFRNTKITLYTLVGLSKKEHVVHTNHADNEAIEYETYSESYLGFENDDNETQLIDIASIRPGGSVETTDIYFEDVASIGGKEIILVKNNTDNEGNTSAYIQVYALSSDEIFPVFEEKVSTKINLNSLSKVVIKRLYTFEKDFIYIEAPKLFDCMANKIPMVGLEIVSHAYRFNKEHHAFELFYEPTINLLKGTVAKNDVKLIKDLSSIKEIPIRASDFKIYGLKPHLETLFAYIKTAKNGLGFVPVSGVYIKDSSINLNDIVDIMYPTNSALFSEQSAILQFR